MHTLIVEDDLELSEIVHELLELQGIESDVIRDGKVAMQYLSSHVPDLLILDLHLPNVSGLDILQQIQSDTRFQSTRIVVTTADVLRADSIREKVDIVLLKPFLSNELLDIAGRLLS